MKKLSTLPSPRHFKVLAALPPLLLILGYGAFILLIKLSLFQGASTASSILLWCSGLYLLFSLVLLPLYLMGVSLVFFVRKEARLLSTVVFVLNLLWLMLFALMMSPTAQSV